MVKKDDLGDRMKHNYENRSRSYLSRRLPCICRLDIKSAHTLTRNMERPFDDKFISCMEYTAKSLCEEIQGCKMAYCQSDEITLLLTDYDKLTTDAWFDYDLRKMCSVSASIATYAFNKKGKELFEDLTPAYFDSRAFTVPKEEVCNMFLWRQNDASRNSISMLAQSNFPHKELQGLSSSQLQDKLMLEKNINWNELETYKKRGLCVLRDVYLGYGMEYSIKESEYDKKSGITTIKQIDDCYSISRVVKERWLVDRNPPIFSQDRNYIERFVFIGEK